MTSALNIEYLNFKNIFEIESKKYFEIKKQKTTNKILLKFWDSLQYTYFLESKRFRPFLVYLTAKHYNFNFNQIVPFSIAIELIHTYSLIHDDLPCMDNDDIRRGQPSNHKVFGEAIALLAGDALQAEAFNLIASLKEIDPKAIVNTVLLFSEKIGIYGMVGGQVLDMQISSQPEISDLEKIHLYKTAVLIELSMIGAGLLMQLNKGELKKLSEYGKNLGLAFQIKDDLLDFKEKDQDFKSYVSLLGLEATLAELKLKSEEAKIQFSNEFFTDLLTYNLNREK